MKFRASARVGVLATKLKAAFDAVSEHKRPSVHACIPYPLSPFLRFCSPSDCSHRPPLPFLPPFLPPFLLQLLAVKLDDPLEPIEGHEVFELFCELIRSGNNTWA